MAAARAESSRKTTLPRFGGNGEGYVWLGKEEPLVSQ
jgi:hypothetical protein